MPVDPTPDDVRRYVEEDDGGPVVMLNLLRYGGECSTAVIAADGHE